MRVSHTAQLFLVTFFVSFYCHRSFFLTDFCQVQSLSCCAAAELVAFVDSADLVEYFAADTAAARPVIPFVNTRPSLVSGRSLYVLEHFAR